MMQSVKMAKSKSYRNNLKHVRQDEGINKASLAREAIVSVRHISRIELEEVVPLIETANRLKNAINKLKTSNRRDYTLGDIFPNRRDK
jgi:DNA-binding XRE family transcriptional regulator